MIKWDLNIWKAKLEMKTTLQIYKKIIKKTLVMKKFMTIDRPSSNVFNKPRTNTLQLNDRNRHTNK